MIKHGQHKMYWRKEMTIIPKRMKICIKDFSLFCIILDHVLLVCIAYVCDTSYMYYINKSWSTYTGKKIW